MEIKDILNNSSMSLAIINLADLKKLFISWQEEMNEKAKNKETPLLTSEEVVAKYRVSRPTLWRWDKMGLLKPIKMGRMTFYRQSDIEQVFHLNPEDIIR